VRISKNIDLRCNINNGANRIYYAVDLYCTIFSLVVSLVFWRLDKDMPPFLAYVTLDGYEILNKNETMFSIITMFAIIIDIANRTYEVGWFSFTPFWEGSNILLVSSVVSIAMTIIMCIMWLIKFNSYMKNTKD